MDIVVLPGLDGTGLLLSDFAEALGAEHSVEVLSYPADQCSYEDLGIWLGDRLPEEAYVIVAESFSGPLAIEIAAQRPKALKAVIFVATFARSPRKIPRNLLKWLKVLPHSPALIAWLSKPFVIGRAGSADFMSRYRSALRNVPVGTLLDRADAVLQVDLRQKLSGIGVPCAYLRAKRDRLVPKPVSEELSSICDPVLLVDAPHFVLQADPRATAALVLQIISSNHGSAQ